MTQEIHAKIARKLRRSRARTALQNSPGASSLVTSVVSGLKEMRNSLRIALRSSPRKRRNRRGGSWRANATGRTNRSPRSRSPPRRRQDDDVDAEGRRRDDAFDGLEALGEAAVISQLTDSLSSEQFVLDPPDASSVEPEPVLAVTPSATV